MGSNFLLPIPKTSQLEITEDEKQLTQVHNAPIVSSFNDRPLLKAVDRLRSLNIVEVCGCRPEIVVVGDQSSGKSSVLESLAGISLPRGQGICTRVPLIMRLQNHPNLEMNLLYNGKTVPTDEENVADAISLATEEIAGKEKGISNTPLTLVVKKNGIPDLTMIDMPGITRHPVHGQPEDIYEQVSMMITKFITPEDRIILNVVSADADFSTSESIKMSKRVDKTGKRTLAVVTKADKSPEGLLEKVTAADDVSIGLGYVCVRNRIGDESYEEARAEEGRLFETHPQLSKMSKSMVGIPVLAEKLAKIQAGITAKYLPDMFSKTEDSLSANLGELKKLPKRLTSITEATMALMDILGHAKESLRKILLEEYPDTEEMRGTARLAEMLNKFSEELQSDNYSIKNFLMDAIEVVEEVKSIRLPDFPPKSAFRVLLQKKVKAISAKPADFVKQIWRYVETVVVTVLLRHCENYPQLESCMRRAARDLISRYKKQSVDWVNVLVEMEKLTDYTSNPEYVVSLKKLMSSQNHFVMYVTDKYCAPCTISGFGAVAVIPLFDHVGVVQEAFDVKMRMTAYWDIVTRRMVDNVALHIQYSIHNFVMNKEIQTEIVTGNVVERMLVVEESTSIAEKRNKLETIVKLLEESKDVFADIMDEVSNSIE